MTNLAKWAFDATYTALTFTAAELNSLPSGGAALSTTTIPNTTGLDQYVDVSFVVTVGGTTTASSVVSIFALPVNQDGTTYGDGYASSTSTQPAAGYLLGSVNVKVGVTSGNTVTGTVSGVLIPKDHKIAFANNLGVALSGTAALTLKYETYNTNLNA